MFSIDMKNIPIVFKEDQWENIHFRFSIIVPLIRHCVQMSQGLSLQQRSEESASEAEAGKETKVKFRSLNSPNWTVYHS